MRRILLLELLKYFKKLMFIWNKASKGWIVQYIGANKYIFVKRLNV